MKKTSPPLRRSTPAASARSLPEREARAPRESEIEGAAVRYAKTRDILTVKMNMAGHRGMPDRLFLRKGRIMFIEFKAPGGKLSARQQYMVRQLNEQRFVVAVCSSAEVARSMIDAFFFAE